MSDSSPDVAPAYTLWVELNTRITIRPLHARSGDEETAVASIHKLFPLIRKLLHQHPQAEDFRKLAMELMNETLRPYTSRWHGWLISAQADRDENGKPSLNFEDEWFRKQFRHELRTIQPLLKIYSALFKTLSEGKSLPRNWKKKVHVDPKTLSPIIRANKKACLGNAELVSGIQYALAQGKYLGGIEENEAKNIDAEEGREINKKRGAGAEINITNASGLAFSGGGIRSATFSLGVTQALAKSGLLSSFDYLSTVSGGGYLGSFLSATLGAKDPKSQDSKTGAGTEKVLKEEESTDEERIEKTLKAQETYFESPEIRHLRNHSRYLLDGGFLLKTREVGLVLAGILFNLLIVLPLPLLFAVITFGCFRLGIFGEYTWVEVPNNPPFSFSSFWGRTLSWLSLLSAFFLLAYPLLKISSAEWKDDAHSKRYLSWWQKLFWPSITLTGIAFLIWLLPACFHLVAELKMSPDPDLSGRIRAPIDQWLSALGLSVTTLLSFFATKLKSDRLRNKCIRFLALISGPLFFIWIYLDATFRMLVCLSHPQHWPWLLVIFFTFLFFFWGWFLNVNSYSPHGYYRNQLSKCYLEAANVSKYLKSSEINDLKLSQLNKHREAPYHLINTTVNLPSSENRELRGRKGDFFLFSKHWCGSPVCGYTNTGDVEDADHHLNLGTAMAISGAAASSSMGWKTKNSVRMLMTLANVRLGYWFKNPGFKDRKKPKSKTKHHKVRSILHTIWKKYLAPKRPNILMFLQELFATKLHEDMPFLNLSDGGHIENLAAYELLRRRCKFIVCVDAGWDPEKKCPDLYRLERYARIDLGIKMHYDLSDLELQPNGYSKAYGCLVKIDYNPPKNEAERTGPERQNIEWGWMLYLKLGMVGYGPGYVMDYEREHPQFPHQSTADQLYDEAQFEAYRALGEASADSFLSGDFAHPGISLDDWFQNLATHLLPDNDEAFRLRPNTP